MLCSVNGEFTDRISVTDRGLAYGDGLFETMRLVGGRIPLWNYHHRRLQSGCGRLLIPLHLIPLDDILQAFLERIRWGTADGVIKLILTRGQADRGYGFAADLVPTLVLQLLAPVTTAPAQALDVCNYRLPANSALAGIKHLNRLDNVLLKLECQQRQMQDGVALDANNNVIETTSANLFFIDGDKLETPDLQQCGVAGVMREFILCELAPALSAEIHVKNIPLTALPGYQAAFSCNSLRGISPVSRIGTAQFRRTSFLDALLQKLLESRFTRGQ